jgi:hypothetical protein
MSRDVAKLHDLVARLRESAARTARSANAPISTVTLLERLSRDSSDAETRSALDMLCRKIAVAGKVWDAYEADWKPAAGASFLGDEELCLLAAVLALYAARGAERAPEERGRALKCLNGSFQALDLVQGLPARDEVRELADAILERVAG